MGRDKRLDVGDCPAQVFPLASLEGQTASRWVANMTEAERVKRCVLQPEATKDELLKPDNHNQVVFSWRGPFANLEINELHAEAFETRVFDESEWNWRELTERHSLGWVTAREDDRLIGFANVLWDGIVHAWLQDVMVASSTRRRGIGVMLVAICRDRAREAGCEYLHVDFEDHLRDFYFGTCGFTPTNGGLIHLT